jgi:hypothetical protein
VFYGRAWCPAFGLTTYDPVTDVKAFHLPVDMDPLLDVAPVATFGSWEEEHERFEQDYRDLMAGSEELEPEGYVLSVCHPDLGPMPVQIKKKHR